jgi:hypothetical protein
MLVILQVEPNAHKIVEHRRKYDRLRKEREDKKAERDRLRRRAEAQVILDTEISSLCRSFAGMLLFMVRSEFMPCALNRLLMRGPRRRNNQASHLEPSRGACLVASLALGEVCLEEWAVCLEEWAVCLVEWAVSLEEWVVCLQGWVVVCLQGWVVVCLQGWEVLCHEEWAEVCPELEVPLVLLAWMIS